MVFKVVAQRGLDRQFEDAGFRTSKPSSTQRSAGGGRNRHQAASVPTLHRSSLAHDWHRLRWQEDDPTQAATREASNRFVSAGSRRLESQLHLGARSLSTSLCTQCCRVSTQFAALQMPLSQAYPVSVPVSINSAREASARFAHGAPRCTVVHPVTAAPSTALRRHHCFAHCQLDNHCAHRLVLSLAMLSPLL